jgi:hypothetical protein
MVLGITIGSRGASFMIVATASESPETSTSGVFVARQEHADAPHAVALLCARRERPTLPHHRGG